MPPSPNHDLEASSNSHRPTHIANLLDSLNNAFCDAKQQGFCSVAASAYAAYATKTHPSHQIQYQPSPSHFSMGTHVGDGPGGGTICSCVARANVPSSPHFPESTPLGTNHSNTNSHQNRYRRRRHQSQSLDNNNKSNSASRNIRCIEDQSQPEPPPKPKSPPRNDLRTEIQNLDDAGKMALVRNRMMSRYKRSKTLELENNVRRVFEDQFRRLSRSGAVLPPAKLNDDLKGDNMLGCKHYARRCKLKANCCGLFVTCRFCHEEAMSEDHEMDRFATKKVLCVVCLTEQNVAANCVKCGVEFAHYFCKECRFYENTPGKQVYHCGRCHICRLGAGLEIDNFHCDNCDACVSLPSKPYHRCMSKALHSNCPVCRGYLFTSTEPVVFMRCGHTMHSQCFDDYTRGSYQCPLCMRSLTDMTSYFEQIDELIEAEPMPKEYDHKRSVIYCCDCQTKSIAKYHFMYHKCGNSDCNSYNTKVLEEINVEDGPHTNSDDPRRRRGQLMGRAGSSEQREYETERAAGSSAHVDSAGGIGSSELYSADPRGSFQSLYAGNVEERTSSGDGQFTQPPVESTV